MKKRSIYQPYRYGFSLFLLLITLTGFAAPAKRVYLIPGQGSDQRLFKNLHLEGMDTVRLHWIMPERNETMNSFARRMAAQIDTSERFDIVGVSLGGMVACEMSRFLHPEKIIIVSSARGRKELPGRYRMLKHFPLNRILPPGFYKFGAKLMQPIVEPDRRHEKATCKAMLNAKDPLFLKRSVDCIIHWETPAFDSAGIVHIHGTHDHTIPFRGVKADVTIENGSHMMMLTRGDEISSIISSLLGQNGTKP